MKGEYKKGEILILDLCDEIDYWKQKAAYWEAEYNKMRDEYNQHLNESISRTREMTGTLLTMALCAKEDENGNLSFDKDARKLITDKIKKDENN